jgi:hypothetical protein
MSVQQDVGVYVSTFDKLTMSHIEQLRNQGLILGRAEIFILSKASRTTMVPTIYGYHRPFFCRQNSQDTQNRLYTSNITLWHIM